jgi:putative membrane protein
MYRRRSLGIAASLIGLFWFGTAYGVDPAHRPEAAKVTSTATFVKQAVVGDLFEVESSKLALDRSQNATVKTFAKLMVDDHSAAGVKLAEAVDQAKQARPPLKLDAKHQAIFDDLAAKKGADFDKLYVDAQHKAHVEAVALFESYSATGEDAQLKALAGQLLPTLKGHLARIEKIAAAWK